MKLICSFKFAALLVIAVPAAITAAAEIRQAPVLVLPPSEENPRNSEGDFIALNDGRLLFVYTHFVGGGGDHDTAHLMVRVSKDGGKTWSDRDRMVIENEAGMNVMSVSLLRLQDGRIALLYLRKNSTRDCRPVIRFSDDEAKTWSEARPIIDEPVGYYVVNNDRLVQLESGRLIVPAALHGLYDKGFQRQGKALCYLSDDAGQTWRRSETVLEPPKNLQSGYQEPGVVELKDGRLLMFVRTSGGYQYQSYSADSGETWSDADPSNLASPLSPASIERIPETGDLLAVWNDHSDIPDKLRGKRTPFVAAISKDEGETWQYRNVLADNPHGWYCYTAITFVGDHVLLGHCAGDRRKNNGLALTQVLRFPVAALYSK